MSWGLKEADNSLSRYFNYRADSTCGVGWVRAGLHFIVAPEVGGEVPLAGEQLAAQRALEVGEQEQVSLLATAHLRTIIRIFSTVVTSG